MARAKTQARPPRKRTPGARYTKKDIDRFLSALAMTCNIRRSAKAAGISEEGVQRRRRADPAFRAAMAEALSEGFVRLEMMLLERALQTLDPEDEGEPAEAASPEPVKVRRKAANGPELSERAMLALIQHHRQAIREQRERDGGSAAGARVDEADARMKLDAMFERMRVALAEDEGQKPAATGDDDAG